MANRIKGITVEINGDSTGLDKALSGVNRTITKTQRTLKDIDKLLKLDPTNTKLLEQKQKELAKAIEKTKEKLDTLREAERNSGSKLNTDQYDALQREIVETEQKLKGLEEEAERTSKVQIMKDAESSLRRIDGELEKTKDELRDVDRLLKLDPGNTELITQKQRMLSSAIEDTSQKLIVLKNASRNITPDDIGASAYDKLQREIIETERDLKELEKQSRLTNQAFGTMTAVGGRMQNVGREISNVGSQIMPVSLAATGLGVAMVKAATDWETAFTGVRKTVDATEEQFEALDEGIHALAKTSASSAEDIAHAAEMAGQLGIQADSIMTFTETMVRLGDATNLSADEAALALAKFINITGDSQDSVANLGAAIADLGNNFATDEASIVNMSTRLASAGTIAGLTSTDILGLATAMSSVGIEAEVGGSSMAQTLKQMTKAVADFENGSADKLTKIAKVAGMSAEEFASSWEKRPVDALLTFMSGLGGLDEAGENATLVLDDLGMSGIRQSNMLQALALAADMAGDAVKTSAEAYDKGTALVEESSKRWETASSRMNQFKETAKETGARLGDLIIPILEKVLKGINKVLEILGDAPKGVQVFVLAVLTMIAVLGPLLLIIGNVVTAIGTMMMFIPIIGTVIGGIAAPILPVIGVIAAVVVAIGGIILAGKLLADHWDDISAKASELVGNMEDFASDVIENIKEIPEQIGKDLDAAGEKLKAFGDKVKDFGKEVVDNIKDIPSQISDDISKIGELLGFTSGKKKDKSKSATTTKQVAPRPDLSAGMNVNTTQLTSSMGDALDLSGLFSSMQTQVKGFINNIVSDVKAMPGQISADLSGAWGTVSSLTSSAWTTISNAVGSGATGAVNLLSSAWTGLSGIASGLWNNVTGAVSSVWTNVSSAVSSGATGAVNFLSSAWTGLSGIASGLWNNVTGAVSNAWGGISGVVSSGASSAAGAVSSAWSGLSGIASGIWNGVKSAVASALGTLKSTVSSGASGVANAFKSGLDKVKSFAQSIFSSAYNTVRGWVNKLKSIVKFSWSLPKLRIPHISVSGKFSLNPPSVPHFSIAWYKKAMLGGMILDGPTIFGMQNGSLLAGGEAGKEVVVGLHSLKAQIADAVSRAGGGGRDIVLNVYGSQNQNVNELADAVIDRITKELRR